MIFLMFMTTWAMVENLIRYFSDSQVLLFCVGGVIFVLELWLVFEAVAALRRLWGSRETAGGAAAGS
jgi:carbon starvation protein